MNTNVNKIFRGGFFLNMKDSFGTMIRLETALQYRKNSANIGENTLKNTLFTVLHTFQKDCFLAFAKPKAFSE